MSPLDQWVHDNAGALYLFTLCLVVIFALLVEQALIATEERRKRPGRALRGWLERRKNGR